MNTNKRIIGKIITLSFLFSLLVAISTGYSARITADVDSAAPSAERLSSGRTNKSTGKIFYISPEGNDKNAGTKEHPFATLERAKLAIKNNKGNPITVYLREGYYPLNKSFVLEKEDVVFLASF